MDTTPYTSSDIPLYTGTATSSAASATFTGDPSYPVFPNGQWLSRFSKVSSLESGITNQDTDLYNWCYLPEGGPLSYLPSPYNQSTHAKRATSWKSIVIEKPDYQIQVAPCKRQAAINTNCYFKNTNGTFSGLTTYEDDFGEQQHCYCQKYPFFDTVVGCQKCYELHGGIEGMLYLSIPLRFYCGRRRVCLTMFDIGYHWFPESYVDALADTYCNANPLDKEFYGFIAAWKSTAAEAQVPSTTAKNILRSQTAASLYYTPNAAAVSAAKAKSVAAQLKPRKTKWALGVISGIALFSGVLAYC